MGTILKLDVASTKIRGAKFVFYLVTFVILASSSKGKDGPCRGGGLVRVEALRGSTDKP